jgi:hypothetical protein
VTFSTVCQKMGLYKMGWLLSRLGRFIPAFLFLLLILFAGAMLYVSKIDDNTQFTPQARTENGSYAVDMAAALIDREVNTYGWTANDPFFMPGHWLDNMPNYQQGIIYALARFTLEMSDQIGRARGSSQVDADLDRAAGLLKYPGTVWLVNWRVSWLPTASSEAQYKAARTALLDYNRKVANGQAIFDKRADSLQVVLDRIAADLGSQSAAISTHIETESGLFDMQVDDIFYATKGRLYAYSKLLEALGEDFKPLIQERQLQSVWDQTLSSLQEAASLSPPIILSGKPDSLILPSHLSAQGFFLMRARTGLHEISAILQK